MIFKILSIVSGIKLTLFFLIFFFNILHLLKPRKILIYLIILFNRNKGYKPLTSLLIDSFGKKLSFTTRNFIPIAFLVDMG